MDRPLRQLWRAHRGVGMFLAWAAALLAVMALATEWFREWAVDAVSMTASALWRGRWIWPLAGIIVIAAQDREYIRRRWPHRGQRFRVGFAVFAGLIALITAAVAVGPGWLLLAVGVAAGAGLLYLVVVILPRRAAPTPPNSVLGFLSHAERLEAEGNRLKLQNDYRTSALQTGVALAVLATAVLGFQQLTEDRRQAADDRALTRQGQAGERFTHAVDQLGSNRQDVVLGGIYGLGQIAQQDPPSREVVTQVLVGYLRRRTAGPIKPPANPPVELGVRAPDVQAVLTVLGQRQTASPHARLDLRKLDLNGANLTEADLTQADLTEANLSETELAGAFLDRATFTSTFLNGANLTRASMIGATFDQAELIEANLTGAKLNRAKLINMRLTMARLIGADLREADLRGADLTGADFTGADLEGANLTGALADGATTWPSGIDPRARGVHFP
jgi:Pentapeptide repeats (8 copies)